MAKRKELKPNYQKLTKEEKKTSKYYMNRNKVFKEINDIMLSCVQGTIFKSAKFKTMYFETDKYYKLELWPQAKNMKETFKKIAEAEHKFIRQSGGRGQYGHVYLRVEPLEQGTGYEFKDEIVGGVIPKEYIKPIDKGIQEAAANGEIAGYPLVDFSAAVYEAR